MFTYFKMKMTAGDPSAGTDQGDYFTALNPVGLFAQQARAMSVVSGESPAVIDYYQQTIARPFTAVNHLAGARRMDRSSRFAVEIDSGVETAHPGDRVGALAEARGQPGGGGDRQRPDQPVIRFVEFYRRSRCRQLPGSATAGGKQAGQG